MLLTKDERVLIRKISRKQIRAINEIFNNPSLDDIIRKAQYASEVSEERLDEELEEIQHSFELVRRYPNKMFEILDDKELNIVKFILKQMADREHYKESREALETKIWLKENIDNILN